MGGPCEKMPRAVLYPIPASFNHSRTQLSGGISGKTYIRKVGGGRGCWIERGKKSQKE